MALESTVIRLRTLKVDTFRQLQEHFMRKVQLQEQLDDNEARLHFHRGVVEALSVVERYIAEEAAAIAAASPLCSVPYSVPPPADGRQDVMQPSGVAFPEYDGAANPIPAVFQTPTFAADGVNTPALDNSQNLERPAEKYGL